MRLVPQTNAVSISGTNITDPISSTIDLSDIDRLSVQAVITDTATATKSFIDGVLATGTVTITSFAAAHFTAASLVSQGVTYTSRLKGTVGNGYSVTIIDSTAGGLSYVELAGAITIDLGGDTPDITTVVALFTGTPSAFVTVTGSGATGVVVHALQSLSGGINAAVVTVAGHALVESTDWNSVTNNDTAADNLAAAIDALSETQAANPAAAVITVKSATVGTAGNSITTVLTSGAGVTVQQAHLTGGLDNAVIGSPTYTITLPLHGLATGLKMNYDVITGTTLANLVTNTDYFVINVDANTIALATTANNAALGTKIHIAAANDAVGGGSFTLTPTTLNTDVTLASSNDNVTFVALSGSPHNYTTNTVALYQFTKPTFKYLKITVEPNDSEISTTVTLFGKSLA